MLVLVLVLPQPGQRPFLYARESHGSTISHAVSAKVAVLVLIATDVALHEKAAALAHFWPFLAR